jgi:predicted O-methyltransferase YrrM
MSSKCTYLTDELYEYMMQVSVRPRPIVDELYTRTEKLAAGAMQTSLEQTQFMQLLVKLIGAKRTIDVGVFTGHSSLAIAMALPEDGEVIACDVSEEYTNIAKEFWQKAGVSHKVKLKLAPAEETLQALLDAGEAGKFDFAFIDANKSSYTVYYEMCLQLIKSNGLVLIDNAFMNARVLNKDTKDKMGAAVRALNDYVFKDERVDISILPIGDGLTIARKR